MRKYKDMTPIEPHVWAYRNREGDVDYHAELILKWYGGIVIYRLKRFSRDMALRCREDLVSAGNMAIFTAIDKFNMTQGTVHGYIYKYILWEMGRVYREKILEIRRLQLIKYGLKNNSRFGTVEKELVRDWGLVAEKVSQLSPREREFISSVYGVGKPAEPLEAVRRRMKMSKSCGNSTRFNAVKKLKALLGER